MAMELTKLMGNKPVFKQIMIFTQVLHEVGGMERTKANAQAQLYVYKELFARGEEINEIEEFKQRFARLDKLDRIPIFPSFFCVRKCIEEFYFEQVEKRRKPVMQLGYWNSIFEVLRKHETWGQIFLNDFELSGCRQQVGEHTHREDSYWISTRICEHYARAKKIADTQAAREELQEKVACALHNNPPQWETHERVKAEFAQKLAKWTKEDMLKSLYPAE